MRSGVNTFPASRNSWSASSASRASRSEPQTVGVGYQGLERVLLPLKSDASGFVGTTAVNLRLKAYRIALKREDLGLAGWDDVIASTEVWVSKEQSVVDASREVDVSQVQTSSGLCHCAK